MKQLRHILVLLSLLIIGVVANAQVTTSSMSGQVTDDMGEVIGANVIAVHEPTGTRYTALTNTDGRFSINNMRVGGPYTIRISYVGYETVRVEQIMLRLAENYVLNAKLSTDAQLLDEVLVVGESSKLPNEKTGTSTNINNEQMLSIPTVGRSIGEMTKLSPYASGMRIAGGDGRSANFTVDGANFNNNFGLSSGLPGGGSPISLDAIEELQVVVAPYDVRQTNFIGGGINAITKSGTNTVKGTAYTYHYNQNMRGNVIMGQDKGERPKSSKAVYGGTIGGPIIKDKLFFFVNAEYEKRPGQVTTWRPSEDGKSDKANRISRASIKDMERVADHLKKEYGYDPGSYSDYPGDGSNIKLLARLDWNITDKHSLNFRYNYTLNRAWSPTNENSTDAGSRNRLMDRISEYGMAFYNSVYYKDNGVHSFSGELNSRFTNELSNKLLVTHSRIRDMRGTPSDKFPFIDILVGRNDKGVPIIEPYITAGYELFSWNNGVNNNTFTLTDNITYYAGTHKFTGGFSYEYQMANNAYMRNGTGYYRYASVDDFIKQAAPIDLLVTYGYGGEQNPSAEVAFNQFGAYLQDEWSVTPDFLLTYGIRADYLKYIDDKLMRNNKIYDLVFKNGRIDTGTWPKARVQLSPRVGFSWDIFGDQTLKLRGGTGIFTGRLPLVFFTNMPTNSGMVQGSGSFVTKYNKGGDAIKKSAPELADFAGKMITDPIELAKKMGLPLDITPDKGALPDKIAGIDPNFKMPQVWKSSLALDYRLPTAFPFSVTVEGIFTKTINGVLLRNWDLRQPDGSWQRFAGPDNRYIYPEEKVLRQHNKDAHVLSNTNEGWGLIGNITLNAEPIKNLNLMASYTFSESRELSGMPGSNAGSAYSGLVAVDGPHLPVLQRSQYVTPHKVLASASYNLQYNKYNALGISLIYIGEPASGRYSAGGFSFTYENDMNGDGNRSDLIYIPAKRGDIKFVSQADEDAFFNFMEQDPYLKANRGKYAGAYAMLAPWVHNLDLKLTHDFLLPVGKTKNKLTLSLDVLNLGNLLNSNWGIPKNDFSASNNGAILKYEGKDDKNVPSFSFAKHKNGEKKGSYITETFAYNHALTNTWRLQLGIRYTFN